MLLEHANCGSRESTFSQVRSTFQCSHTATNRPRHEISGLAANDLRSQRAPEHRLTRRDVRRQKAELRGDLVVCLGLYFALACIYLLTRHDGPDRQRPPRQRSSHRRPGRPAHSGDQGGQLTPATRATRTTPAPPAGVLERGLVSARPVSWSPRLLCEPAGVLVLVALVASVVLVALAALVARV